MEIKVKDLGVVEEKSSQQIEEELLKKHEDQQQQEAEPVVTVQTPELKEEDVLSYLGKRYGKEINSFDELNSERSKSEELPEDVAAYYKFKKETGRGLEDFVEYSKKVEDIPEDDLLKRYYLETEEGLDNEDVDLIISDRFDNSHDTLTDHEKKKRSIDKKRELAKAKKFLEDKRNEYFTKLESSDVSPKTEKPSEQDEIANNLHKEFLKRTDEVFGSDFKGFDFNVDEKSFTYSPGDANEVKEQQSSLSTFLERYIGNDGKINDPAGYHKALSVAMNPERFAKFFYEKGKADAIETDAKRAKNINMEPRQAPSFNQGSGLKVRSVGKQIGKGLKIKSIK